ncbi:AIR synthase related protein [Methanococcus vannielii SB]|jgi:hydrogenase expression/formation protein|uniref:AIR synthase related protein n=1 Tax=Methanococcus vannielii (strain ATCC 35089 / DSM 1224 / JCM 13029 / OCM 148 / SB) TaxID=406327 RepID=A6URS7_METVS|nr:AIR synthase-related protein [Methanococcus vannielii]ABR55199.1 AIR synthase related protein [Methanococcus vannielii SB]
MDIEGYVRRCLKKGISEDKIIEDGFKRVVEIKETDDEWAKRFLGAVLEEVKTTEKYHDSKDNALKYILDCPNSGITMGKMGVGSRGQGDFFVHREIARIIESTKQKTEVDSTDQDDAGVVRAKAEHVVVAIDGTHSRLSDFPFLAGFHVARAALRDVYVMGADAVALISDIHLADDGDVSKIFDYTSGICAVSEAVSVPLVAGSTLRVGGDMVLGDRMVSAVGAIGVIEKGEPTARKRAEVGDVILMTEGSGGGTISTTALYYGMFDVIGETINVDFLKACKSLIENDLLKYVHVMTDVTNGGLRGDAYEISNTAKVSLEIIKEDVYSLINPKVLKMLEELNIDPLGVSIDSLLIIAPNENSAEIMEKTGAKKIGIVKEGNTSYLITKEGKTEPLIPKFREAAYTPVKKIIGEQKPDDFEEMKEKVKKTCDMAIEKKNYIVNDIIKKD